MHKIFAKPSFLGKNVVYLPECHSTNDELAELAKRNHVKEGTLLYTGFQSQGKGQRGNKWESDPNQNILCSLLIRPERIRLSEQHYMNLVVGLAVVDLLDKLFPTKKFLKWPNDIYVRERKIGGILIENNVKNGTIESSIIGIGLNINQSQFSTDSATSVLLETNQFYRIEEVLEQLLCQIEKWYIELKIGDTTKIKSRYYERLMWMNELHEFKSKNESFSGEIQGIDEHGRLLIEKGDGKTYAFGIKEVEFIA